MALVLYRVLFAGLALGAILTELLAALNRSVSVVNFFSFLEPTRAAGRIDAAA